MPNCGLWINYITFLFLVQSLCEIKSCFFILPFHKRITLFIMFIYKGLHIVLVSEGNKRQQLKYCPLVCEKIIMIADKIINCSAKRLYSLYKNFTSNQFDLTKTVAFVKYISFFYTLTCRK